jgi:hypothetical protein
MKNIKLRIKWLSTLSLIHSSRKAHFHCNVKDLFTMVTLHHMNIHSELTARLDYYVFILNFMRRCSGAGSAAETISSERQTYSSMNLKCHFSNLKSEGKIMPVKFVLGKAKIRFLEVLFTRFVFANT